VSHNAIRAEVIFCIDAGLLAVVLIVTPVSAASFSMIGLVFEEGGT